MTTQQPSAEERILFEMRVLTARRLAAADNQDWILTRHLADERQACVERLTQASVVAAAGRYRQTRTAAA